MDGSEKEKRRFSKLQERLQQQQHVSLERERERERREEREMHFDGGEADQARAIEATGARDVKMTSCQTEREEEERRKKNQALGSK